MKLKRLEEYGQERHHIVPESWKPEWRLEKNNFLVCSAKAHYVIHHLMWKAFPNDSSMEIAFFLMVHAQQKQRITARVFEKLKESNSKTLSEKNSGERNPRYGATLSEETKKLIGAANKGRKHKPRSQEYRDKFSKIHKGRVFSEEHKKRISLSKRGKRIKSSGKGRKLSQETKDRMREARKGKPNLNKGKKRTPEQNKRNSEAQKNRPKLICPHCGMSLNQINFTRWHRR